MRPYENLLVCFLCGNVRTNADFYVVNFYRKELKVCTTKPESHEENMEFSWLLKHFKRGIKKLYLVKTGI